MIRNPEVLQLVPSLLGAITRPNDNTKACLDTLLDTVFVNTVDAASLALIVPVLNRALRERTTELKKKAAKVRELLMIVLRLLCENETAGGQQTTKQRLADSRCSS